MRDRFRGKDFLTLMDFSKEEITYMLDTAADLKKQLTRGEHHDQLLRGRTLAMIFEKKSTRTRVSFQAGAAQLGAQSFYMRPDEMQLGRGEPIKDTARTIDRYCDGLFIRTFGQEVVEEFARYMERPVINALTDLTHPCQGLADLLTIREKKGRLENLKWAYVGDIYNVCHTSMVTCGTFGMDYYVACPKDYQPNPQILEFANRRAAATGAKIVFTEDLNEAVRDADIVYANTFHSMGVEDIEKRVRDFAPYQINAAAMAQAKHDAIFMHCLPGYRGEEMTDEVVESAQSVVFDQAENRMHTEKAVLALFIP
jgi:ornithine carbamoyltransferase